MQKVNAVTGLLSVVFDKLPDMGGSRFIEVEDAAGNSVRAEWSERADGRVELVFDWSVEGWGKRLARAAAQHLLEQGAENYVGDVFAISLDDAGQPFEVVVTTQKTGAISPHERAAQLQEELDRLRSGVVHPVAVVNVEQPGNIEWLVEPTPNDGAHIYASLPDVKRSVLAWLYEHDGSLAKPVITLDRWHDCKEPWSETALCDGAALGSLQAEAERLNNEWSDESADHRNTQVDRDRWRSAAHGALARTAKLEGLLRRWLDEPRQSSDRISQLANDTDAALAESAKS